MQNILNKKIHLFLQKLNITSKNVLVGFSSGADSTALLYILNQKRDFFDFKLNAVFFSHDNSPLNKGEVESCNLAKKLVKNWM